jgi:metal-responsive CopG/Arc/MetJ family transcriptional regulator
VVKSYKGINLGERDIQAIDEAIALLDSLYGFAPKSRAELVRTAVREFLQAKRKEWTERHPEAAMLRRPPGRPPAKD